MGQEADARLHLAAVSLVLAVYVVADFIGGGAATAVGKDLGVFAVAISADTVIRFGTFNKVRITDAFFKP